MFSLGLPKRESKQQKKERLKKEKEWKQKKKQKNPIVCLEKKPLWRLLPSHACQGFAFWIDTLDGQSFFEKQQSLLEQINHISERLDCPYTFPLSQYNFQLDFLEKTKDVELILYKNQGFRWRFKRLLNRMRIRNMKKANEVDPFTLESYKQPIQVVSYSTRVIYTFEAESFTKHVTKRLLNNDGHIAMPLYAQNPLTNQIFSIPQTIGLLHQSRKYGHSSWPIEALSSCGYSLQRFVAVHNKPLRLHALHATMAKHDDWEQIDTLFDFIQSQHTQHEKICQHIVYKWAILHLAEHECIRSWRRLCRKWYEIDILIDDESVRDIEYEKLEKLTVVLCESPIELIQRRKTFLVEKSRANGGSSS